MADNEKVALEKRVTDLECKLQELTEMINRSGALLGRDQKEMRGKTHGEEEGQQRQGR